MRMPSNQALDLLLDLHAKHKEADAMTVFEMWRDELDRFEANQIAQRQSMLQPNRYGLVHGYEQMSSTDESREVFTYVPDRKVVIAVEKLDATAKTLGLTKQEARALVNGEVREVKGWRGHPFRGSSNVEYKPVNTERLAMIEELRREDEVIAKRASNRPSPYVTPTLPIEEVYI